MGKVVQQTTLVFLIDALGHRLVGEGGFLDLLCPGERPRLRSILGFSSAAIPTILTGKLPQEHGHWSMYRRNQGDSPFERYRIPLSLAGRVPRGQWRVRRWLTNRLSRDGITGYFSLYEVPLRDLARFDLCARRNIYSPGAFETVPSLFDRLEAASVPYRVWDWSANTDRAFSQMEEAVREGSERLLFLYTAELDAVMHTHGPRSPATDAWLARAEERITKIVQTARQRFGQVRVRVFGDHGMAPVHAQADLMGDLGTLSNRRPHEIIAFFDSTMARFWFEGAEARAELVDRLSGRSDGRFLTQEELTALGVSFPGCEYGEEIFLIDPGVLILPSFMGSSPVRGMHGYHPDDPDSHTVLIADPMPEPAPAEIRDLYRILLSDVGIDGGTS